MPVWLSWGLVALGGSLGATARYAIILLVAASGTNHPAWGTLFVNVLGAFGMGVVVGLRPSEPWRLLFATGVLGGFTTFSTMSLDFRELYRLYGVGWSLAYVIVTLVAGLLALEYGRWLAAPNAP